MATWIYFVLSAQLIWAFCSLIDKFVISKGHIRNPMVYIVLNGAMNVLLVFFLPFFDFSPLNAFDFSMALLSSAAVTAAIIIYYKVVQYEEISRILMLFQFIPIFSFFFFFFFSPEKVFLAVVFFF